MHVIRYELRERLRYPMTQCSGTRAMSSGKTAEDKNWKGREQGEEARYVNQKEQEQLAAIRNQLAKETKNEGTTAADTRDKDFEGGFGGQEDLEDRYATTSGEH